MLNLEGAGIGSNPAAPTSKKERADENRQPFLFSRNVWCPASSGNGLSGSF